MKCRKASGIKPEKNRDQVVTKLKPDSDQAVTKLKSGSDQVADNLGIEITRLESRLLYCLEPKTVLEFMAVLNLKHRTNL